MEKYKRIFDTLRLAYNKFNEEDIVGVFLYGSQNYNLDRENSDIDIKVITLPSLDIITKGTNPYSKEKELLRLRYDDNYNFKEEFIYLDEEVKQKI